MSLTIEKDRGFSKALKLKIREECNNALQNSAEASKDDPHHAIHEIRKSFKKIRGALRLVRDHFDFYKKENVFFRDEGRKLSDIRDATSVIEALDKLYHRYDDQLYQKTFDQFREHLLERRKKMTEKLIVQSGVLKGIENSLSTKIKEIDHWPIEVHSFETIAPSIQRVYKRGRKGYGRSQKSNSTEDFHQWRKRVKYLRYQLRLLEHIWPAFLDCWEDELHKLSDFLGDDHDLHMLNQLVEDHENHFSEPESYELLKSIIEFQRSELQAKALKLGKSLYYLDREDFCGLIGSAWEVTSDKPARLAHEPLPGLAGGK